MPLLMLLVFALTLFVSALLLFLIEPMIGKMMLPMLGGSPAVWNTCMVFFQAMLLAGYGYAHLATRRLGDRKQAAAHAVVLLVPVGVMLVLISLVGMPIGFSKSWAPPGEQNPVLWVLLILFIAVGLPFFVVSASAPLLQRWFAQTGHSSAKDPYFLYAASNVGSMLALFGYPTLIEPHLSLPWQSWLWLGGYVVLLGLTLGCAYLLWRSPAPAPELAAGKELALATAGGSSTAIQGAASSTAVKETKAQRKARRRQQTAATPAIPLDTGLAADQPSAWRKLHWVALAFVPSSLMLGATTYITTDIAAIPLLWVLPLALYLLSFILVFSRLPDWVRLVNVLALPLVVLLLIFTMTSGVRPGKLPITILLHLLTLFVVAMVCHGELARNRPATRYLTEFYVWMSVGGVLGGLFNALVAPVVFSSIVEYQLAMVLACLLMPPLSKPADSSTATGIGYLDLALVVTLAVTSLILIAFSFRHNWSSSWNNTTAWRLAGSVVVAAAVMGVMLARAYLLKGQQRMAALLDVGMPALLGLLVIGLLWCFPDGRDFQTLTGWVNRTLAKLEFNSSLMVYQVRGIIVFGVPALLCYLFVERPLRFGLGVAALLLVSGMADMVDDDRLYRDRSFFGVLTVNRDEYVDQEGNVRWVYHRLTHGTTTHGEQQFEPPEERRRALSYYHRTGPIGTVFTAYPEAARNYAVIGLGTGTMASYCRGTGDKVTFYEIDRHVRDIANNADYFTYLTDCRERGGEVVIRMGDARLQIDLEDDPQYRLVVVDAFSSDAIPVHLINKEGVETIFSKTAADGIVAYHISNRHLDLEPVLQRIAEHLGLTARVMSDGEDKSEHKYASTWVVLARQPEYLRRLTEPDLAEQAEQLGEMMERWPGAAAEMDDKAVAALLKDQPSPWKELKSETVEGRDPGLWTDDYSNVLSVFMWK